MTGLIVHEWLEPSGGAEQVVEQFTRIFPGAALQVLWNDAPERFPNARETWLARTPLRRKKPLALPLMPATWRRLAEPGNYEWLLVSSHLFAHHAKLPSSSTIPKLVYVHTPARYIWDPEIDARGRSPLVKIAGTFLRPLDARRAQEARSLAANSHFTAARIGRAWGRDATVIYPPVATEEIASVSDWSEVLTPDQSELLDRLPATFLLGASRFVPYKRLELVIRAGEAADIPVVLAGDGPDEARLRSIASTATVPVHFVNRPPTSTLRALYQRAWVYVFPAIEDFGIMPIEAMAAGTPVVVPSVGGAAETVRITNGGDTFADESATELRRAVESAGETERSRLSNATAVFSTERFRREISEWVHLNTGAAL